MTNTQLWDLVCKTNPEHTKKFTKSGGFSGTAIKPFYLMHKATQIFGVCGIGWGWNELENKMVGGVWCSKVELWFMYNNQRGAIQQWGQTVMQGKNKHGDFVDEEAPKKAVTDAVTKCLSYLGFAGDVHMGRFDDSKYVDEITAQFHDANLPVITTEQALEIDNKADELGVNKSKFLEKLGVDEVHKIKAKDYETALKLLALKEADNKKKAAENAKPTTN